MWQQGHGRYRRAHGDKPSGRGPPFVHDKAGAKTSATKVSALAVVFLQERGSRSAPRVANSARPPIRQLVRHIRRHAHLHETGLQLCAGICLYVRSNAIAAPIILEASVFS